MTRIFGVHEVELRPEVDPAEYERYFVEEVASQPSFPGWSVRLLKGDRGARTGKYLVLFEVESEEARDRFFPAEGEESEEFALFMRQHPELMAAWQKTDTLETEDLATDYVVVAE